MPGNNHRQKTDWTAEEDAAIIAGRAAGRSWISIGLEMHRCTAYMREHACRDLGLPAFMPDRPRSATRDAARNRLYYQRRKAQLSGEAPQAATVINREPLPAGHPVSWGAISSMDWTQRASV